MLKKRNFRWIVVGLLFSATTINYIDRQVIGLLKPYIEHELGWTESDYGYIVSAFQLAYAVGMLGCGWLLDRFGVRWGYALAVGVWSIGAVMHAGMRSVAGFAISRVVLGLGEAANFPAAVKATAEWFPKRDRALVTGIFNSGSSIGAILAPFLVASITLTLGWEWAFIITGAAGILWIVAWLIWYRSPERHTGVTVEELKYIQSDDGDQPTVKSIRWQSLLNYKQTYAICFSRFITDWVWWFFLFWAPDFLEKKQGMDLKSSIVPLVVIYTMAGTGGIAGGWLSSTLIRRGWSIDRARKGAILTSAIGVLPLSLAVQTTDLWLSVAIIGLAAAAHSAWASNIFTLISDIYPKGAVATMVGFSGFTAAIGGALAATIVGWTLELTGSYLIVFFIASLMYLLAWITLKWFVPAVQVNLSH